MTILKNIRTVGSLLEKYKSILWMLILLSVAVSLLSAVVPLLYGKLVDAAITGNSIATIFGYLGIWFLASLLISISIALTSHRQAVIAERSSVELVIRCISHLLLLPIQFHKEQRREAIWNRVDRASSYLNDIADRVVFGTFPEFVTLAFSMGFLFLIDWRLVIIVSAFVGVFIFATLRYNALITKSQRKLNQSYEFAYGEMGDMLANVDTVKAFARERFSRTRIERYFRKLFWNLENHHKIWRNLNIWQHSVASMGFMTAFTVSLLFLRQGTLTVGEFVTVIGYLALVYRPFWNLTMNVRVLKRGVVAIDRAMKLLALPVEQHRTLHPLRPKKIFGHFEVKDLHFAYHGDQEVIKGISFIVKPGEIVAFVGKSGVGKTTLANLLCNFYQPTQGSIQLDGHDTARIDHRHLRKHIGIVPQEVALFNDTIKNNIRYSKLGATDEEIKRAAHTANAAEFIDTFPGGYEQVVGERGIKLSTGQKQRVAIARVALKNPSIIILDEATAALDSHSEKMVQEALARLIKGKTTFIIAHRLSTIRHADKIIVLDQGTIAQIGTHHKLIRTDGIYKDLCSLQQTFV